MIFKNKKSLLLMYGLMAGLLGAVIFTAIYSGTKQEFNVIGDSSLILIGVSKEAEKSLFYLDQSSKYSAQQTIYDLAKSGGFAEESECGNNFGFALWQATDEQGNLVQCYPVQADINDTFEELFLSNLNEYLENYNEISDIKIPTDNYENVELKDKLEIIAIANENIEIPIT